jgi:hypothetical protein
VIVRPSGETSQATAVPGMVKPFDILTRFSNRWLVTVNDGAAFLFCGSNTGISVSIEKISFFPAAIAGDATVTAVDIKSMASIKILAKFFLSKRDNPFL